MKNFLYSVLLQVEVEAYDEDDAALVIQDCFGEGEACGLVINGCEVLDFEELS